MVALTVERLKELLHYDPETGVFTWINAPYKCKPFLVGKRAGCIDTDGYRQIKIEKRIYVESRLAFLYMTGELPRHMAEHKNRDILDNRWSNLRLATNSQNQANRIVSACSRSGVKGVRQRIGPRWSPERPWVATCQNRHLGAFSTKEDAAIAYRSAASKTFGEFARFE